MVEGTEEWRESHGRCCRALNHGSCGWVSVEEGGHRVKKVNMVEVFGIHA
jgi:hypothetical protein